MPPLRSYAAVDIRKACTWTVYSKHCALGVNIGLHCNAYCRLPSSYANAPYALACFFVPRALSHAHCTHLTATAALICHLPADEVRGSPVTVQGYSRSPAG
eukprot:GHUV01028160.1.p2 GENE.GHUV01028160.1~~GHUV01028160.1.p2  ORF type:complete len:101 (+),score=6.68 GHUV01028160.1:354-656(+)